MYFSRLLKDIPPNLRASLTLLFLIVLVGSFGFRFIEGEGFFTALYWTVATITTVGYGDVVPHTPEGRIFGIIIIVSGVSTALYTLTAAMAFSMEGELKNILGTRKMEEEIKQLKNHVIVCGYGKVGKNIVANLTKESIPFVVIEENAATLDILARNKLPHVTGDATYAETLENAGISRAKILISCLSDDADNLYVTMEAKEINPKIHLIIRASRHESVKRLQKVGADKVILPEEAGAIQMASVAREYFNS